MTHLKNTYGPQELQQKVELQSGKEYKQGSADDKNITHF